MEDPHIKPNPDYLEGWKEVAVYLARSVRTVQRWEHTDHLPVHRVAGSIEVVWASKTELDAWKRQGTVNGDVNQSQSALAAVPAVPRGGTMGWRATIVGSALLVAIGLASAGYVIARHAPLDDDDDAVFDTKAISLRWQEGNAQRTPWRLTDGSIVDPGFMTFGRQSLTFQYLRRDSRYATLPYALSELPAQLASPRLRFTYVPHRNARVRHTVGFMQGAMVRRTADAGVPWFAPADGVGATISRINASSPVSEFAISRFTDGRRVSLQERTLSFQLDPGVPYSCTLMLEGRTVSATISDGRRIEEIKAPWTPIQPATVFVTGDTSVGFMASPGRYAVRFNDIQVRDGIHNVRLSLASGGISADAKSTKNELPSATGTITLAILANRNLDSSGLQGRSIRLNGIPPLTGKWDDGVACHVAMDVNGDGLADLVCGFDPRKLRLQQGRRELTLEAETTDGHRCRGHLSVNVVN